MTEKNIKHIVIVAGGDFDRTLIGTSAENTYFIGADRGALYLTDSGYRVDLAVGDFDSVTEEEMKRISGNSHKVIRHPSKKNDTDLELALKLAMDLKGDITVLGATGSRLDQTFSAIELLKKCEDAGREACIIDRNNRISCVFGLKKVKKSGYKYISLIPYGEKPVQVSLKGFKYSGEGIILEKGSSLGVSNEIAAEEGIIKSDNLILIFESND